MAHLRELSSPQEKSLQGPLHPCNTTVREVDEFDLSSRPRDRTGLIERVRGVLVAGWRMRRVGGIHWGVRDWSRLRIEVGFEWPNTVVRIFGAYPGSAFETYVPERLGWPSRVKVACVGDGDGPV